MAGDPELDVPFEDRSLVRIFWTETGHSGPGLYCECVDAEEEGCILLDGTAPAIGQSAQGVDLGQFRPAVECLKSAIEDGIADAKHMLIATGALDSELAEVVRLLALIDSQAVGNG